MSTQIKAAMVHKTWIDGAREVLSNPEDRCEFYDAVFDLYFTDQLRVIHSEQARAIFVMVRPYILADRQRYADKCERNRENARKKTLQSQANGSDRLRSQDLGSNNNNNTNSSINNNSNNNNNILSLSSDEERDRESFDILGILFYHRASNVREEMQRFYNYYEALGWRTNKGAPIVNRRAAARQWRVEQQRPDSKLYDNYYMMMQQSTLYDARIYTAVRYMEVFGKTLKLHYAADNAFIDLLEKHCIRLLVKLTKSIGVESVEYELRPE